MFLLLLKATQKLVSSKHMSCRAVLAKDKWKGDALAEGEVRKAMDPNHWPYKAQS